MSDKRRREKAPKAVILPGAKDAPQESRRADEEHALLEQRTRELAGARAALASTLEATADAILVTGEHGDVVAHNDKLVYMLALEPQSLVGRSREEVEEVIAACCSDPAAFRRRHAEVLASADQSWDQFDFADGRVIEASSVALLVAGKVVGRVFSLRDVTERLRSEVMRGRLAEVVESSDDAILSKDLNGVIQTWNRGAQRIFGWTAAEMIGQSVLRIIPPERHAEEETILGRLRRGERIDHYETVRITKDGRHLDVSLTVSPIRDRYGRIHGASKVARDITDKKQAESELRRRSEELRALADSIPQIAWIAQSDGYVTWFNGGWYEYTGTTREDVQGWGWQAMHDPQVLPRVQQRWHDCLVTGEPFEMEHPLRGHDGSYRWFLTRVRPIRDDAGRVLRWFGTSTDVDEVKHAREALREESRLLNVLNETGKSIAAELDQQTLVQTVTDAATQLSGAEFGAFFCDPNGGSGGSRRLVTFSGADRACLERFEEACAQTLFGPIFRGEGPVRIDDLPLDGRYGAGLEPDTHLPVRSCLAVPVVSRNGDVLGGLFFGHSRPGMFTARSERFVAGIAAQGAIAMDNARLYDSVKGAAEDRQQLLEAERSARAEVERVSFMKDEFLATLSHELRTPLNAIVGWSQVLRIRGGTDAETHEALSVIDRNAKVQAQLIEDLLDMSRIISGKVRLDVQRVDVQDVVRAAIASVDHSAQAKEIRLQIVLDPRAGPVWGDPGRLQQCFWNLLSNSIKFTAKGGKVQVQLTRDDSHVSFTVTDNGQGIAAEFLPHVFERFRQADASTTRRHGGLGLGLSIVKSLVELHGGSVAAASGGPGQGATFSIQLPLMVVDDKHVAAGGRPGSLDQPSLAGITVLAVDDEPDARGLIKRVLEDCGARVLVAESAKAALAVLERERVDLLLSDIGMPDEDGYALIRQVRQLDPAHGGRIPAAALSAFARPEDRTRALRAGYQIHLSKPVEPAELCAVVASLAIRR